MWVAGLLAVCLCAVGAWQFADRSAASSAPAPAPVSPGDLRLLLITCDTTRADFIGCYGNPQARTPNIDRLAAQGTRFTLCTACTPLTLPSHTTLLTGVYPTVHGVRRNALDRLSPAFETLAETLQRGGFSTHAIVASFVLSGRFGLAQGFDSYSDRIPATGGNPAAAERRADAVCEEALVRLRTIARERFFLWVHFYDPHYPYESAAHPDPASREAYADEIAFMDTQIGRLLEALEQLGLSDRTLVVLVGDHGEGLGEHGESEHGYFVHDTVMRVPLIFRCPGLVAAGQVIDEQVRTIDVTPTVRDYLGVPPGSACQGTSLRALIAGQVRGLDLAAYGEAMQAHALLGLGRLRFLQQDGWKYVHSSRPALFNLRQDPHEQNNLAEAEPQRTARMREQLRAWLAGAVPAPVDQAPVPALSEDELNRLASLGYAGGLAPTSQAIGVPQEPLDPGGEDPLMHVQAVETYVRAHRLVANRQYAAAEPLLLEVARALPRATEPLHELRLALRSQNREDEMLGLCAELAQQRPEATAARAVLGELLLREGREDEAVAEFNMALTHDPRNLVAHLALAGVYRGQGDLDRARDHYEAAVELAPRELSALHGLAQVCMQQGRFEEAVRLLRRALAIQPHSAAMQRELEEALRRVNP